MSSITIPIEISPEILIALNKTEQELQGHFQQAIAIMLFQEEKLTFGKALQLSGLSRFEFEKALAKSKVAISNPDFEQVMADVLKMRDL